MAEGAACLMDLDLAARGDRHVDLWNLLAHLTEFAQRRFGDPQPLSGTAQAFLDGYGDGGGVWSAERCRDGAPSLSARKAQTGT